MKKHLTNDGNEFYFDDDHEKLILSLSWWTSTKGYPRTWYKGRHYLLHQLIGFKGHDHIDRNKMNNCQDNFRPATNHENIVNSGPRSGKFKGVHWSNNIGQFVSQICVNGKKKHLGLFRNEIEAAKMYDFAAIIYFGDRAYLNFGRENK